MASPLPVYSARDVRVNWWFPFEGFSGDNIVKLSYNSDLTSETVSADGKLATSVNPDRTGTIVVEVMATSKTNTILSALLAAQNNQPTKSNIFRQDFIVGDPAGSVVCIGRGAYMKKAPEVGLGIETGTAEWTFVCEDLEFLPTPQGAVKNVALTASIAGIVDSIIAQAALG